jgi:hypothetical protein
VKRRALPLLLFVAQLLKPAAPHGEAAPEPEKDHRQLIDDDHHVHVEGYRGGVAHPDSLRTIAAAQGEVAPEPENEDCLKRDSPHNVRAKGAGISRSTSVAHPDSLRTIAAAQGEVAPEPETTDCLKGDDRAVRGASGRVRDRSRIPAAGRSHRSRKRAGVNLLTAIPTFKSKGLGASFPAGNPGVRYRTPTSYVNKLT